MSVPAPASVPPASTADGAAELPVALLLPGQGTQAPGMAFGLYGTEPAFTAAADEVLDLLGAEGGRIRDDWAAEAPAVPLDDVTRAQPLLFTIDYALGRMLMDWGVRPAALLGHSAGEAAAAALAGVFTLPDAVALMAERVELIATAPPGGMLAVAATTEQVAPHLTDEVVVGAVNSTAQLLLAGPDPDLDQVAAALREAGHTCARAKATSGFHSPSLAGVCARQIPSFEAVVRSAPAIPVVSGYTAQPLTAERAADAAFWAMQPAEPVLFGPALDRLLADGPYLLVEAGPGQSLITLARRHPSVARGGSAVTALLDARSRGAERDRAQTLKAATALAGAGAVTAATLERIRETLAAAELPGIHAGSITA